MAAVPRVSVIVATYNRGRRIVPSLKSILGQTLSDLDVWVIGDGCTDDTDRVVADLGDPRLHWRNRPANSGSQAAPNNEGLSLSQGAYVAYLGHDDLWFPWHLELLVGELEQTGADLAHDLVGLMHPQGEHHVVGEPGTPSGYSEHFIFPSSWVHRRSLSETLGGWRNPDQLPRPVDIDFLHRAWAAGALIKCRPRLGVLKWVSTKWRAYDPRSPFPQDAVWQHMATSAESCEAETLNLLTAAMARQGFARRRSTPQLLWADARSFCRRCLSVIQQACANAYGRDRWPLRQFFIWRQQRRRTVIRAERGLE